MITHKQFLNMAFEIAKSSKCVSMQVGSIIVKNNRIISLGYNGTPPGYYNCDDLFEHRCEEHTIWSLDHEIHAEMNAILYVASSSNDSISGATIYSTHEPCKNCLKHIMGAQISECYYAIPYYNESERDKKIKRDFIKNSNFPMTHIPMPDKE